MSRFAHLHQHTQYSLLDGAARIKDLIKWVKSISENPTIAMTDHGNMHGAVQFFKTASDAGVKPIVGYEAYIAAGSRFDRRVEQGVDGGYFHLTLLAKDFQGYQSLCKLSSLAFLEGYYYKPRIDREILAEHFKGLVAMSGCLGAEVPNLILQGRLKDAEERLIWYQNLFKDDYYIEIQDHGLPEQKKVNPILKDWANKYGIAMVATNDGHYVKAEDAFAHETLLAIQTKAFMSQENRFKFPCNEFYVKTPQEMRETLKDWKEEIFDNTMIVADKCNLELPIGTKRVYQMPQLPIPQGRTMAEELRIKVYLGLTKRYQEVNIDLYRAYAKETLNKLSEVSKTIDQPDFNDLESLCEFLAFAGSFWQEKSKKEGLKYTFYPAIDNLKHEGARFLARAEYELGVIIQMGFPDYFLIVADFIVWAKEQEISVGPGRGSGAGSIVAYSLSITNIDPLEYGLLFERFLNPDRVSMPDFDIDFSDTRRGEVIDYVRKKYGDDKVAYIATFGTMSSRAVFKDVARVMELPYAEADKLSKLVPVRFGRALSLSEAEQAVPDIREILKQSEQARQVFETARSLEGLTRHASVHASGIVIGREPLVNLVPLMRDSQGQGTVCQLDMSSVEDIGLIKMDFLGLRTLSFLEEAKRIIKESKGVEIEPDKFPIDDKKTYELLSRGETKGVFQLEGSGISDASRKLKPNRIQDIIALSALYRPGPMENIPTYIERHHGREEVRYDQGNLRFPSCEKFLRPILEETYGIPVYQEQIMQIASEVAGYSLGQADILRRVMGKKKVQEMEKERAKFINGSKETNNVPEEEAGRLFDLLESFANYGFNKSHSAAYAFISFQTAYIKAHYPVEFMAALLTVERHNSDKIAEYINDARQITLESGSKIEVLPPDINLSADDFKVIGEKILFGLFAIKNLGDEIVKDILEDRNKNGKFKSLPDFCARIHKSGINRRGIESLIKAGAFDAFNSRESLLNSVDDCLNYGVGKTQLANEGADSLFSLATIVPEPKISEVLPPTDEKELREFLIQRLKNEKESVGIYITGHPLEHYPGMLEACSTKTNQIEQWYKVTPGENQKKALLSGIIEGINRRPTKNGGMMARFNLTDDFGTIELVAFNRAYEKINQKLAEDIPALVVVDIEPDIDSFRISVDNVLLFEEISEMPKLLWLEISLDDLTSEKTIQLDDVLREQTGIMPARLRLDTHTGYEIWDLENVKANPKTIEELKSSCPWVKARLTIDSQAVLAKFKSNRHWIKVNSINSRRN